MVHRLLLAIRKDRFITLFVVILFIAGLTYFSSFLLALPTSQGPRSNEVYQIALIPGNASARSATLHLADRSYYNVTYNLAPKTQGQMIVTARPYGILHEGKTTTLVKENISGSGSYSVHETEGNQVVTYSISLQSFSNTSGVSTLNLTSSSYYQYNQNQVLLKVSVILFLISALGVAYRASYINRNPDRYWFLLENGRLGKERLKVVRKVPLNGSSVHERSHAGLNMFIVGVLLVSLGEFLGEFVGTHINLLFSFVLVMVGAGLILMSPIMAMSLYLSVER